MERRDLLKGIAAGLSALGFKEATADDPVARESFVLEPGQEIPVVIKLGDATYSFTAKLSAIAFEAILPPVGQLCTTRLECPDEYDIAIRLSAVKDAAYCKEQVDG